MPAVSSKQAHMAQMALAVKRGHRIEGLDDATQKKLHSMAHSMTQQQLKDFSHVAKGPKKHAK